jgi:hypothetical protein
MTHAIHDYPVLASAFTCNHIASWFQYLFLHLDEEFEIVAGQETPVPNIAYGICFSTDQKRCSFMHGAHCLGSK